MKTKSILIIIIALCVGSLITGCGDSELQKFQVEANKHQKHISDLEAQLTKKTTELTALTDINRQLSQQVKELVDNIQSLETRLAAKTEARPGNGASNDISRVEILGAKAVAEFQAEQLRRRMESLGKDFEVKEKEIEELASQLKDKDADIAQLKQSLASKESQELDKARQLAEQVKKLETDLAAATEQNQRLAKLVEERNDMIATLRTAAQDSGKLKAGAEEELAKLRVSEDESKKLIERYTQELASRQKDINECSSEYESKVQSLSKQKQEHEKLLAETEDLRKNQMQLRASIEMLNHKLKTTQAGAPGDQAVISDQPAEEESFIDRILQPPSVSGADSDSTSHLY